MRKRQLCVASMVLSTALVLGACGSKNAVDNTNEPPQSSEITIVAENDSKNEMEITEPTEEIKKDPDGSEDNKPSESKPSESKPSEDNSSESKPSESKPSEDNSSESKPSEDNSSESKPSEDNASESKPSEDNSSESKPSEDNSSESKPSEIKPSEDNSSESKPSEDNSSESKPSETKPSESKPSEEKPSESSTVTTPEDKPDNGGNNSSSDASSFTGGNISLDNIGISIPTLDKFNNAGLKENDEWFGGSWDTMETIYQNAQAIMNTTGFGTTGSAGNGFTITEYYIEWAYASYGAVNDLSLKRDTTNGYYVLEINTPLDVNYSGAAGGGDISPVSRDIVKFLCSVCSSNPKTLYDYLYNGIYNDASTLNCSIYQKVGDCKVLLDENFQVTNGFHLKFYIKPAN